MTTHQELAAAACFRLTYCAQINDENAGAASCGQLRLPNMFVKSVNELGSTTFTNSLATPGSKASMLRPLIGREVTLA